MPFATSNVTGRRAMQLWIAALVVAHDQVTKAIVRAELALHESVVIIPGFLDLTRVHNTGAAFGFLDAVEFSYKPVALAIVAVAALVGLAVYSATLEPSQRMTR